MIKLIACDLDGTILLNGETMPHPELFHLIQRLRDECGILFVVASGRQYYSLRTMFAPVADKIGYVCENGCLSMWDENPLNHAELDRSLVSEVIREIQSREGTEFVISSEKTSYIQPKQESFFVYMRDVIQNDLTCTADLQQITDSFIKIAIFEEDGADKHIDYWQNKYGSRVHVVTGGNCWIDMMPTGISKQTGLEALLSHLGIAPEECIAFGDNFNDEEMLSFVGTGVSMETAVPGIYTKFPAHTSTIECALLHILNYGSI